MNPFLPDDDDHEVGPPELPPQLDPPAAGDQDLPPMQFAALSGAAAAAPAISGARASTRQSTALPTANTGRPQAKLPSATEQLVVLPAFTPPPKESPELERLVRQNIQDNLATAETWVPTVREDY